MRLPWRTCQNPIYIRVPALQLWSSGPSSVAWYARMRPGLELFSSSVFVYVVCAFRMVPQNRVTSVLFKQYFVLHKYVANAWWSVHDGFHSKPRSCGKNWPMFAWYRKHPPENSMIW